MIGPISVIRQMYIMQIVSVELQYTLIEQCLLIFIYPSIEISYHIRAKWMRFLISFNGMHVICLISVV
jgi:hypothetical protein